MTEPHLVVIGEPVIVKPRGAAGRFRMQLTWLD